MFYHFKYILDYIQLQINSIKVFTKVYYAITIHICKWYIKKFNLNKYVYINIYTFRHRLSYQITRTLTLVFYAKHHAKYKKFKS